MFSARRRIFHSGKMQLGENVCAKIFAGPYLPWAIICFGVFYRLFRYFENPALWLDEAMLARNFLDTSFGHLFGPLLHDQFAPIGYLVVTWVLVSLFGSGEYVLRLLPLVASIASVLVFWKVACRFLSRNGALASLVMFALAPRPVYYASEAKQYELEVLISLLFLWLYLAQRDKANTPRKIVLLSLCGSLALIFSFTAPFVLGGVGTALGMRELRKRNWRGLAHVVAAIAAWLCAFAIYWYTIIIRLPMNVMTTFWHDAFLPLPPTSLEDVERTLTAFTQSCEDPLGLTAVSLVAFLFLLGILRLAKGNGGILAVLALPLLLTVVASGLHLYPFNGRLLLFYVPLGMLVIGSGVDYLHQRAGASVLMFAMAVLLFHPACLAAENLFVRDTPQGVREAFKMFHNPEDMLVPAPVSIPEFNYYAYRTGYFPSTPEGVKANYFPWPPNYDVPSKRFFLVESMLMLTGLEGDRLLLFLKRIPSTGRNLKHGAQSGRSIAISG